MAALRLAMAAMAIVTSVTTHAADDEPVSFEDPTPTVRLIDAVPDQPFVQLDIDGTLLATTFGRGSAFTPVAPGTHRITFATVSGSGTDDIDIEASTRYDIVVGYERGPGSALRAAAMIVPFARLADGMAGVRLVNGYGALGPTTVTATQPGRAPASSAVVASLAASERFLVAAGSTTLAIRPVGRSGVRDGTLVVDLAAGTFVTVVWAGGGDASASLTTLVDGAQLLVRPAPGSPINTGFPPAGGRDRGAHPWWLAVLVLAWLPVARWARAVGARARWPGPALLVVVAAVAALSGCTPPPTASNTDVAGHTTSSGRSTPDRAPMSPPPTPGSATPAVVSVLAAPLAGPPVRLQIPTLAIDAEIVPVTVDQLPELTQPGTLAADDVGRLTSDTADATVAPLVQLLVGHRSPGAGRAAVFGGLRTLRAGALVRLVDAAGRASEYEVRSSTATASGALPSSVIDGATEPTIVLVTCEGAWDAPAGHSASNRVVVATARP